jgi:hypothetical protein
MNKYEQITDIKKRREAFLDDTAAYYNINNRGINDRGNCSYSAGCAIGRFLNPDLARTLDNKGSIFSCGIEVIGQLPLWMQEMGGEFLESVQIFHDDEFYWDDNGLNRCGLNMLQQLKEKYA